MIDKKTFQHLTQKRGFAVRLEADADGPEVRVTIRFKGRTIRTLRAVAFMTVEFPQPVKEVRGIKFHLSHDNADFGEDNTDIILRDDALLVSPGYLTVGLNTFAIDTFVYNFRIELREGAPNPAELAGQIGSGLMRIMKQCFELLQKADNTAIVRGAVHRYFPDAPSIASKFAEVQAVFAGGACSPK